MEMGRCRPRCIAGAVDRELSGLVSAPNVLNLFLRANDFEGFYRQAAEVRDREQDIGLLPRSPHQQFVNTRVPRGVPLPQSNVPEPSKEALRSRRVTVSGLYTGAIVKAPLFAVQAPLGREGGQDPYVLSLLSPGRSDPRRDRGGEPAPGQLDGFGRLLQ